jgi:hypothetical protein
VKKIGLLALAVVLALGSLGFAYAMWYEDLFIEGTVYTGELDADWIVTGTWDSETPEKDVSWVEAYVDGKTLYVTVHNAYPCIDYEVYCDILNSGTIPFHVCGLNYDISGMAPGSIGVYVSGTPPYQVHPDESFSTGVWIHLNNDALQGATYTFTFDYVVVQYNEACPPVDLPFY